MAIDHKMNRRWDCLEYLMAALCATSGLFALLAWVFAVIMALVLALSFAGKAHGADCGQFFVQKQVVGKQYYQQAIVAAPVYYQAGRDIEADAYAEKIARLVAPKITDQIIAKLQVQRQQQQLPDDVPPPLVRPSSSAIAQHCGKCHSGSKPKKGLTFDGETPITCVQLRQALIAIRDNKMPNDHQIEPAVKGAIMDELIALSKQEDGT